MIKKIHPIASYSDRSIQEKESFLLSRNEIRGILRGIKRDITNGEYQLFRLTKDGKSEVTIVKKGSIHMDVLKHLIFKPKIKTYVL